MATSIGNKIRLTAFLEDTKLFIFGFKGFLGNLDLALLKEKLSKKLSVHPKHHKLIGHFLEYITSLLLNQFVEYLQKFYELELMK